MANLRRTHVLFVAATIVLIYIIFFSGPETTDFRKVTESSLSSRRGILRGTLSDSELTAQTNQLLQRILDKKNEALIADSGRVDHVPGTASNPKENPKPKWPPVVEKMGDANSNTESPAVVGETPSKPKPTDDGLERAREELYDIFRKSPSMLDTLPILFDQWLIVPQSSYFPSPTVHIRSVQKNSYSKLTPSYLNRMWSNLT